MILTSILKNLEVVCAGNILQAACSTKKRIGDVPIYK